MGNKVRVCVIGAGPSGIAAAKNAIQYGFDVVVFEKNNKVGGHWVFNASTGHSSVYEKTHIISSKAWSEYEDFPVPAPCSLEVFPIQHRITVGTFDINDIQPINR